MLRRTESQGFSTIGIIATVLAISVVGLAGWYVWNKNHKDNTTKVQNKNSQKNEDGKKDSEKLSDPSENGKYFVIKEWNIRFELPESMKTDTIYGLRAVPSTKREAASFEIGSIASLPGSNCKLIDQSDGSGKSGGIGVMLIRSPETVPSSAGIGSPIFTTADGRYFFYATSPKGLCAPVQYEQTELDAASSLEAALSKVEEVPVH